MSRASSALGAISDILDVPLAYGEAGLTDLFNPHGGGWWTAQKGSHWAQVNHDLMTGGAHKVAMDDVYFRPGSLNRVLADPHASPTGKAAATWFLHHPWVSGGADFATEFANPSNALIGPALGLVGKGLHELPFVGKGMDALGEWGKSLFDKYHPLRKAGGEAAAMGGRLQDAAAGQARLRNEEIARSIFGQPGFAGGTTQAERFEILRQATGGEPRAVAESSGLAPEEITRRANQARMAIDAGDNAQVAYGQDADKLFKGDYFPMKGAYEVPKNAREIARGAGSGTAMGGRPTFRGIGTGHKVFNTFDDALDAVARGDAKFAPDFDGGYSQLIRHLNRVSGNTALDGLLQRLAETPAGAELTAGGKTGAGALGAIKAAATRKARGVAIDKATADILQKFPELDKADVERAIKQRYASPQLLRQKIIGATRSASVADTAAAGVRGLTERAGTVTGQIPARLVRRAQSALGTHADAELEHLDASAAAPADLSDDAAAAFENARAKPVSPERLAATRATSAEAARAANIATAATQAATARISGAGMRLAARMARVSDNEFERAQGLLEKLNTPDRDVATAFRKARDKWITRLTPAIQQKMIEEHLPSDMVLPEGIDGLSSLPRAKYTALHREAIKYFAQAGAAPAEATAMGSFFNRFNALYRIGVLTNPLVHPFYNLLWGYLGGGGNPLRLANVFRGGSPLEAEAAKFGAHAAIGGSVFAESLGRLVQSFPDAVKQSGIPGAMDWFVTRAADANRHLVFDVLEKRMATEFWASLVAKGADKAQAGAMVRKTFGDYDNLTAAERNISKAFFFYPWTKAVIPFWLKALGSRPQFLTGPLRGIQTHNALAGDPNWQKELPYTLYTGTQNGVPHYQALPLPQKRVEDVMEMALPRVAGQIDPEASVADRVTPALNMAQYHLVPGLSAATAFGRQVVNQQPQQPGVTPAQGVMFDRAAPVGAQLQQIAQYVGANNVPFAELVRGIIHAGSEAASAPGTAASQLVGGFQYSGKAPAVQRALTREFEAFQRAYNHAFRIQDAGARRVIQTRDYALFMQRVNALLGSPSAAPSAVPQGPVTTPTPEAAPFGSAWGSLTP